jgi:DNA-binding MarR family transcriptional regulator
MTATRLSRLQQQMLRWLHADERRSRGGNASRHQELVQAVPSAKGNMSHRLRLLETRGLLRIGRSPGRRAESVTLTTAGRQKAAQLAGSYDEGRPISGTRTCHLPRRSHIPSAW